MTREIKFREWNNTTKKMDYDPTGYCSGSFDQGDFQVNDIFSHNKFTQYIGLKDKNGTEIYEGDIVRYSDALQFEVKWVGSGFWLVSERFSDAEPTSTMCAALKVIGNIYENQELLEDKNE